MSRVLLAGGGTGGHVFPSLAVAEAIRDQRPELSVEFVGTAAGLESRLVPQAGWTLHLVAAAPLPRRLSPALARLPVTLARSTAAVTRLIRGRGVVAAAVFGGYVSVPLALAAKRTRTPLVVHEQNAVPGLANRLAARWAARVAVSFPGAAGGLPRPETVVLTGNPVRPGLAALDRDRLRSQALAAFDLDPGRRTLLVFGGSQGALRLNRTLVASAGIWSRPERLQILHAAGRWEPQRVAAAWEATLGAAGPRAPLVRCLEFIDRMDLAYAAADVALCRAGASTVAELAVLGLPAVLVPLPQAHADEQTGNARALVDAGGAALITDRELEPRRLVDAVERWLLDDDARGQAARAARGFGRPHAARRVAELVLAVARDAGAGARR